MKVIPALPVRAVPPALTVLHTHRRPSGSRTESDCRADDL